MSDLIEKQKLILYFVGLLEILVTRKSIQINSIRFSTAKFRFIYFRIVRKTLGVTKNEQKKLYCNYLKWKNKLLFNLLGFQNFSGAGGTKLRITVDNFCLGFLENLKITLTLIFSNYIMHRMNVKNVFPLSSPPQTFLSLTLPKKKKLRQISPVSRKHYSRFLENEALKR